MKRDAELEALRAEVERLTEEVKIFKILEYINRAHDAEEENANLREALERIAEDGCVFNGDYFAIGVVSDCATNPCDPCIARAALGNIKC